MCGRYFIDDDSLEIKAIIEKIKNKEGLKTSGEIFPGDIVPVVCNNRNLETDSFKMKWGYSINKTTIINAKCETIYQKKLFVDGIKNRRCVIPATNYFEWEGNKKNKYSIKSKESDVIYLAGIYRIENNTPVFSIITRFSDDNISFIHERMPLIIEKENISRWLDNNSDITDLLNINNSNVDYKLAEN